jgi:hypothetical protein
MTYTESDEIRAAVQAFLQERRWLQNLTPRTLSWHAHSLKMFAGCLDNPDKAKARIGELRQRGVAAISVNSYLCSLNASWRRRKEDRRIPRLKEEQKILATFSPAHVAKRSAIVASTSHGSSFDVRRSRDCAAVLHDCEPAKFVIRLRDPSGVHVHPGFRLELTE